MAEVDIQNFPPPSHCPYQGYNANTNYVSNYTPKEMNQHIDFLEFLKDGQLTLGTSSLNRRFWTGDIWWFRNGGEATQVEQALTGVRIDSGIVTARSIGEKQILLGLDSGGVQLVNLYSAKHEFKGGEVNTLELQPPLMEHEDSVTDLDTWASGENLAVTVGRDARVCVWSKSLVLVKVYNPAHTKTILSVSANPHNSALFSTAGGEGCVKIWDMRKEKPALTLYSSNTLPPGAISHSPSQEHQLVVASRTGDLFTLDCRMVSTAVPTTVSILDREVRVMRWRPDRPNQLALAGDDTVVSVVNVSEEGSVEEVYRNTDNHTDFVRALAWSPEGTLWSGGWDRRVNSHQIPGQ